MGGVHPRCKLGSVIGRDPTSEENRLNLVAHRAAVDTKGKRPLLRKKLGRYSSPVNKNYAVRRVLVLFLDVTTH